MYIQDLATSMHAEWLHNLTMEELAEFPDFILPKYFLDEHGRASVTKMKVLGLDVVSVPFPRDDSRGIIQIRKSADKINLYHLVTVHEDLAKEIIHLGWSEQAVFSVLRNEEEDKSHDELIQPLTITNANRPSKTRADDHGAATTPSAGNKNKIKEYSPVGTYTITCKALQRKWLLQTTNMSMKISAVEEAPGILEAVFHFGFVRE